VQSKHKGEGKFEVIPDGEGPDGKEIEGHRRSVLLSRPVVVREKIGGDAISSHKTCRRAAKRFSSQWQEYNNI